MYGLDLGAFSQVENSCRIRIRITLFIPRGPIKVQLSSMTLK